MKTSNPKSSVKLITQGQEINIWNPRTGNWCGSMDLPSDYDRQHINTNRNCQVSESQICVGDVRGRLFIVDVNNMVESGEKKRNRFNGGEYDDGRFYFENFVKYQKSVRLPRVEDGHSSRITCISCSVNLLGIEKKFLLSGDEEKKVCWWKINAGMEGMKKELWEINKPMVIWKDHEAGITSLKILEKGYFASSSLDKTVRLYDITKMEQVRCYKDHEDSVRDLASLTNRLLFSCSSDKKVMMYNYSGSLGTKITSIEYDNPVYSVCGIKSSGNVHYIVAGEQTGCVSCVDMRKRDKFVWKRVEKEIIHNDCIREIVHNDDEGESTVITCSDDKFVNILRLRDGKLLKRMKERGKVGGVILFRSWKFRKAEKLRKTNLKMIQSLCSNQNELYKIDDDEIYENRVFACDTGKIILGYLKEVRNEIQRMQTNFVREFEKVKTIFPRRLGDVAQLKSEFDEEFMKFGEDFFKEMNKHMGRFYNATFENMNDALRLVNKFGEDQRKVIQKFLMEVGHTMSGFSFKDTSLSLGKELVMVCKQKVIGKVIIDKGLHYFGEINESRKPNGKGYLVRVQKKNYYMTYYGYFVDGKREGRGQEFSSRGGHNLIFEGLYKDDVRNGRGRKYKGDGKMIEGVFRDQKVVKRMKDQDYRTYTLKELKFRSQKEKNLLKELGKGAFGKVYRINFQNKPYALKLSPLTGGNVLTNTNTIRKIERSVQIACGFDDAPYLSKIYGMVKGYGPNKELRAIGTLMELCESNLSTLILSRSNFTYPIKKKVRLLFEIAEGIRFLHSKNIMHRDLKPSNILIGFDEKVRICDFDDVREDDTDWNMEAEHTQFVGSPAFADYLVFSSTGYDKRIDIFSYGMIIYCILFEKNIPYEGMADHECACGKTVKEIEPKFIPFHVQNCNLRPKISDVLMNKVSKEENIDWLLKLMQDCWSMDLYRRPHFDEIVQIFKQHYLRKGKSYIPIRIKIKGIRKLFRMVLIDFSHAGIMALISKNFNIEGRAVVEIKLKVRNKDSQQKIFKITSETKDLKSLLVTSENFCVPQFDIEFDKVPKLPKMRKRVNLRSSQKKVENEYKKNMLRMIREVSKLNEKCELLEDRNEELAKENENLKFEVFRLEKALKERN